MASKTKTRGQITYAARDYDPGTDEHRAGRPSPSIPEGSVECWNCGAVIAWEGEPPTDCIRCGEAL